MTEGQGGEDGGTKACVPPSDDSQPALIEAVHTFLKLLVVGNQLRDGL